MLKAGEPSSAESGPAAAVLRRPVAVLVSRFPLITETFILRELIEMERQGQPVVLVPLIRERPEVVHESALPWVDRAMYTPFLSPTILAANLRYMVRHPLRTLTLWLGFAAGTAASPGILLRTLALLPKSVYLAERLPALGVHHLHAHYATYPTSSALMIASQADLSFSFTIHAHDIFVRRNLYRQLLRRKIEAARFVRVISEFARHHLAGLFPKETRGRLRVIRVGIDPKRHRPSSAAAGSMPQPARLLCVAGLKPYKGLIVLLRACVTLKQHGLSFRCQVVGDGPERARLARCARNSGLDDVFELLGVRSEDEVARLLAEATLFALPSLIARDGQMEGIPVALMEAMASGLPVVASRLSGIPELVEDDVSGLLVKPGDVAALADAIERLIGDAELRRRLGARGRRRVEEHFRLDRSVSSLLGLIDAENDPPLGALGETIAGGARSVFGPSPAGLRQVHRSRDATVAEVLVGRAAPESQGDVIVKVHRSRAGESRPAALRARHEYLELARLDSAFSAAAAEPGDPAPRLGVPTPLHLDEGQALLVMRRCTGRSLQMELHASRGSLATDRWARVRDGVCHSGQWLRHFQGFSAPEGAIPTAPGMLDRAIDSLGAMPRLRPLEAWVEARLRALGDAVIPASAATVGRHGDFQPSNVFVSDRSLEVIDFEGSGAGLPFEDVATFLIAVDLTLAFSPGQRMARELEALFLSGYLGTRGLDSSALAVSRALTALELLAKLPAEAHLSWPSRFRRRFALRRILRRSLGDVP